MVNSEEKKTGAVLVQGGGIAGLQASIDLANSGFKVFLVERSESIGGTMVMLDKTFPTGDCAMCMISPKLVEVSKHPNIEVNSMTEVVAVDGEPGRFSARLHHRTRSVDADKCTGCGACTQVCPVHNVIQIPDKAPLPELDADFKQVLDDAFVTHGDERSALIAILQEINDRFKYLPRQVLNHLADRLSIPESEIIRVATFYNSFSLTPVGRHIIEICSGTACHVKGANRMLDRFQETLQVSAGQTTSDKRFTLRTVNCLGCCALAPAVRVDGKTYGYVKVSELPAILNDHL